MCQTFNSLNDQPAPDEGTESQNNFGSIRGSYFDPEPGAGGTLHPAHAMGMS